MPDTVIGPCLFCGHRATCAPLPLGDPRWAVFCRHCEVTVTFWQERYPTLAAVQACWHARTTQGELFATTPRS